MSAILFVPLATDYCKPRKIKVGSVSVEPPPALILMNPAANPTPNKINKEGIISIFQITINSNLLLRIYKLG